MFDPEKPNTPWSKEPGFKATLTREGLVQAQEDAGSSLDVSQFVTDEQGDLITISLPEGGYHTVGGVRFMVKAAFRENGVIVDDVTEGNVFDVRYPGIVLIEGLQAGEQWLNWAYNPDGSPR
jgi:hypothetical protein